jgi:zinc protease
MVGLSHLDADRILDAVRSVTSDEVKAVAAKYFGDDALTVATLLPQPPSAPRIAAPAAGARH